MGHGSSERGLACLDRLGLVALEGDEGVELVDALLALGGELLHGLGLRAQRFLRAVRPLQRCPAEPKTDGEHEIEGDVREKRRHTPHDSAWTINLHSYPPRMCLNRPHIDAEYRQAALGSETGHACRS
eukprot:280187-Rhodomonas_salina.4